MTHMYISACHTRVHVEDIYFDIYNDFVFLVIIMSVVRGYCCHVHVVITCSLSIHMC